MRQQCPAPSYPFPGCSDATGHAVPCDQGRPWWSDDPLPEDQPATAWGLPRNLAQAILRREGNTPSILDTRQSQQYLRPGSDATRIVRRTPELEPMPDLRSVVNKSMAEMYERILAAQDRVLAYVASVWANAQDLRQLLGRIERRTYVNRPGEADFYLHPERMAVAYDHERGAFHLQPFNKRQHPELILTTVMRPMELPEPENLEGLRYTMRMDYVSILGVLPDAILRDATNSISLDLERLRTWKRMQSIGTNTPRGMKAHHDLHPGAVPWYWPVLPPAAAWYEQQHGSRPHQATSAGE